MLVCFILVLLAQFKLVSLDHHMKSHSYQRLRRFHDSTLRPFALRSVTMNSSQVLVTLHTRNMQLG